MKRLALCLVVLAACKQAKEPTPASELIAKVRDLAAKACACRDTSCLTPLAAEWNGLTTALGGSGKVSGTDFTEEQVEALTTEDERFSKCVAAINLRSTSGAAARSAGAELAPSGQAH
ncbi:MAG TPA: hypothetical protein VGM90_39385 [Kofleriaceae bacterium]|jgi:hypothetical protein